MHVVISNCFVLFYLHNTFFLHEHFCNVTSYGEIHDNVHIVPADSPVIVYPIDHEALV